MRKHIEIVGIEGNVINKSEYIDAVITGSNAWSYILSEIEGVNLAEQNQTAYINKNCCMAWDKSTPMEKGNRVWIKLGRIKFYKK